MGTSSGRKGFIRRESCELVRIYRSEIRKTALGSRGGNERVGTNERACSARAVAFYAPRLKILKTDCVTHVLSDWRRREERDEFSGERGPSLVQTERWALFVRVRTHARTKYRVERSNRRRRRRRRWRRNRGKSCGAECCRRRTGDWRPVEWVEGPTVNTQYPRVAHTLTQVRNHVNDTTLASRGEVEITLSRRWNFREVDGNPGILERIIKIFRSLFSTRYNSIQYY